MLFWMVLVCRSGTLPDFCESLLSEKAQPGWFQLYSYKAGGMSGSLFGQIFVFSLLACYVKIIIHRNLLFLNQGLNNAVALDFHYAEQMIYWTDVTTQGSMIRRMQMNGTNMEVRTSLTAQFDL